MFFGPPTAGPMLPTQPLGRRVIPHRRWAPTTTFCPSVDVSALLLESLVTMVPVFDCHCVLDAQRPYLSYHAKRSVLDGDA